MPLPFGSGVHTLYARVQDASAYSTCYSWGGVEKHYRYIYHRTIPIFYYLDIQCISDLVAELSDPFGQLCGLSSSCSCGC